MLKGLYLATRSALDKLDLSDAAIEYYAIWVIKSKTNQLKSMSPYKQYLYALSFLRHQVYFRQDILIQIFTKCVQSNLNKVNKILFEEDKKNQAKRRSAIRRVTQSQKSSRQALEKISGIHKSSTLSLDDKMLEIGGVLDEHYKTYNEGHENQLKEDEKTLGNELREQTYYDAMKEESVKIQNKVTYLLESLLVCKVTSDSALLSAITAFQAGEAISKASPMIHLSDTEVDQVLNFQDKGFNASLYKSLLFKKVFSGIKSGKVNFIHSYQFRSVQSYLIAPDIWKLNRDKLIKEAGLGEMLDIKKVIKILKEELNQQFKLVNEAFISGKNTYLSSNETGRFTIRTPAQETSEDEFNSQLLSQNGQIPILQIFKDINEVTGFSDSFDHHSNRGTNLKPTLNTIFAGILGKGCNIGLDALAKTAKGVNVNNLKNTVNWFFSLKNLKMANEKVIAMIDKISLAKKYQHDPKLHHTSSDGKKIPVSVDSIYASYSYKYFGQGKGVSIYTFIDERQLLFYSTVISAAEREAIYVVDGLLQNDVVKSDIHSTDTHGFSEAIFATTHFMGTSFAPRIKKLGKQRLYGFQSKQTLENKGYELLPSRTINRGLIEKNWDDTLRFMVSIKLRHVTASQLFKRLNAYAADHPLYQAIKEFGRIIKSIFVLKYVSDLSYRQRIQGQLNRVEHSNKFSDAIFFDNNREFKLSGLDDQKVATSCRVLIQNCIVLWNYLYLSQVLANQPNRKARLNMAKTMMGGSVLCWVHVNLRGVYDFRLSAANDLRFDMDKIMSLKVA